MQSSQQDTSPSPLALDTLANIPETPPLLTRHQGERRKDEHDPEPTRFGPIAQNDPLRSQWGGTYDATWQQSRAPLLPTDLNPIYWQSAPHDQLINRDTLSSAPLILNGFRESHPSVSLPLPYLNLNLQTRVKTEWHRAEPKLQMIHVDIDTLICTMTYAASWPVSSASADIDIHDGIVMMYKPETFRVAAQDHAAFETKASGVAV